MLVLSRKIGERIVIGDNVVLTVLAVKGRQVRLGIEAPAAVPIRRETLTLAGAEAKDRRTLQAPADARMS